MTCNPTKRDHEPLIVRPPHVRPSGARSLFHTVPTGCAASALRTALHPWLHSPAPSGRNAHCASVLPVAPQPSPLNPLLCTGLPTPLLCTGLPTPLLCVGLLTPHPAFSPVSCQTDVRQPLGRPTVSPPVRGPETRAQRGCAPAIRFQLSTLNLYKNSKTHRNLLDSPLDMVDNTPHATPPEKVGQWVPCQSRVDSPTRMPAFTGERSGRACTPRAWCEPLPEIRLRY